MLVWVGGVINFLQREGDVPWAIWLVFHARIMKVFCHEAWV